MKNGKLGSISSYWEFGDFDELLHLIRTGSWIVVYACWRHVLYRLYSKFSHLGMHVGSFTNLVLCGSWGFVELGIIA